MNKNLSYQGNSVCTLVECEQYACIDQKTVFKAVYTFERCFLDLNACSNMYMYIDIEHAYRYRYTSVDTQKTHERYSNPIHNSTQSCISTCFFCRWVFLGHSWLPALKERKAGHLNCSSCSFYLIGGWMEAFMNLWERSQNVNLFIPRRQVGLHPGFGWAGLEYTPNW